MGFLNEYLDNNRLDPVSKKVNKQLEALEEQLKEKSTVEASEFDEALKKYGPQILDLVHRAAKAFKNVSFSFAKLKIISKLAVEVYQLVDTIQDVIITSEMTDQEKDEAKISFGRDLIYFIYLTINPLKNRLRWLPFKKMLEKKVVLWLAEMGLESAMKVIDSVKDKVVESMAEGEAIAIKVL